MAGVQLYDYQLEAVQKMRLGCILCGGVGSGKSRRVMVRRTILCTTALRMTTAALC